MLAGRTTWAARMINRSQTPSCGTVKHGGMYCIQPFF